MLLVKGSVPGTQRVLCISRSNGSKVLISTGKNWKKKVQTFLIQFFVEPSDMQFYLDVKQYLANQRQGTHKTKERAEVAGSTLKSKTKGTGARAGSAKIQFFKLVVVYFGPRPK